MQVDRRSFVAGGLIGALGGLPELSLAQPGPAWNGAVDVIDPTQMEQFEPLPDGFNSGLFSKIGKLSVNFGAEQPPELLKKLGTAILEGAPINCRPIDVAYYFNNIRLRRFEPDILSRLVNICKASNSPELATPQFLSVFAYDWERNTYFNPVVVGFFRGNRLHPYAGDLTPWCAAFANWCISRSRVQERSEIVFGSAIQRFGTRNASSGSFRCWGNNASKDPREGDIIVWAKVGTEKAKCPVVSQGHVGFVSSVTTASNGARVFQVLGGNQGFTEVASGPAGSGATFRDVAQAVSYRRIGMRFADRVFHSVRTAPFLR
jgi:hypothetical protein